jgi:CheY-like chemotaxis protein
VSDRKPTVLVIDDEKVIRRVTRRALEPTFLVIEAADGEQGLALLDRRPTAVDLVLTDFVMPRIDGGRVIAVLSQYRPDLPILGMTGPAVPALREHAARHGVQVLEKPFDLSTLRSIVQEVLAEWQKRKTASAAPASPPVSLVDAARALTPFDREDG